MPIMPRLLITPGISVPSHPQPLLSHLAPVFFLDLGAAPGGWSQIAAELRNPHGIRGRSILGAVNYLTAAICQLTHDQPATACTPAVRSLLPGG